ncbi:MAG: PhnD/SsuA/transferrin family substrate-binding protein [Wenzhouxiangellaceae bacterium]|nr:PhnD/SsuA/transferrin family substrate-binding protein [Wenzhouxiangellaceae bacterium]
MNDTIGVEPRFPRSAWRPFAFLSILILALAMIPFAGAQDDSAAEEPVIDEAIDDVIPDPEDVEAEPQPEVTVQSLTGPIELLVHPTYPPDQARLVYQPLVDYLNATTPLEFELVVTRNFHRYWLDARRNRSAPLILEDAHIAAWRMDEFGYMPLVRPVAPKTFSLLTMGQFADDSLEDFVGRRISSMPSPSLGYMVLANWFSNPLQQPAILSNAASWLDAVEIVFSGEADAAIVPDELAVRYPNLYVIETSPELPGLTLSASPDIPDDVRRTLIEAMTSLDENADYHSALFELDVDEFVEASPDEYADVDEWLSGIFTL